MSEKNGNVNSKEAIEGQVIVANPTRLRLGNIKECRRELAKVYSEARQGAIPAQDATRLTYILIALSNMIKDADLEERVSKLEETQHGKS